MAAQCGIDALAVERARNKSLFETQGSDQGLGDPGCPQRMSCPPFCRADSGRGTEDVIDHLVFYGIVRPRGGTMQIDVVDIEWA